MSVRKKMTLEEFVEAKIEVEKERINNFVEVWNSGIRDEVVKILDGELTPKEIDNRDFDAWETEMQEWGFEF